MEGLCWHKHRRWNGGDGDDGTEGRKLLGHWHFTGRDHRVLRLHRSQGASGWGDSEAPRLPLPGQAQTAQPRGGAAATWHRVGPLLQLSLLVTTTQSPGTVGAGPLPQWAQRVGRGTRENYSGPLRSNDIFSLLVQACLGPVIPPCLPSEC